MVAERDDVETVVDTPMPEGEQGGMYSQMDIGTGKTISYDTAQPAPWELDEEGYILPEYAHYYETEGQVGAAPMADFDQEHQKILERQQEWRWYKPWTWDWSKANPFNWFSSDDKPKSDHPGDFVEQGRVLSPTSEKEEEKGAFTKAYEATRDAVVSGYETTRDAVKKGYDATTEFAYDLVPNELGGQTAEEKKQGVNFQPNLYQKIMHPALGGWTNEELEKAKMAGEMAGYIDRPNFWQRRMPTWLGGWSNEEIARSEKLSVQHGDLPSRPNLWERYMPTWLGGASQEEVARYDKALEERKAQNPRMNAYRRHAHEWLGGASNEEIAAFDKKVALDKKVVGNVTVGDLLQAGFSQEKVEQMQKAARAKVDSQIKKEAASNPMGLTQRLGQVAQPVQITAEELGVTRQEMQQIALLNQQKAQTGK